MSLRLITALVAALALWPATASAQNPASTPGPPNSASDAVKLIDNSFFDSLDQALVQAIGEARQDFSDEVAVARSPLAGTGAGLLVLALISAAGSTMGLWQRLKEYR